MSVAICTCLTSGSMSGISRVCSSTSSVTPLAWACAAPLRSTWSRLPRARTNTGTEAWYMESVMEKLHRGWEGRPRPPSHSSMARMRGRGAGCAIPLRLLAKQPATSRTFIPHPPAGTAGTARCWGGINHSLEVPQRKLSAGKGQRAPLGCSCVGAPRRPCCRPLARRSTSTRSYQSHRPSARRQRRARCWGSPCLPQPPAAGGPRSRDGWGERTRTPTSRCGCWRSNRQAAGPSSHHPPAGDDWRARCGGSVCSPPNLLQDSGRAA